MDSEANNCNGTTANSGLAQSNVYKNDSHCMQRTVLDMNVDTDVSHYICRILANLINYTPRIYADGYIVFAFPFVRSSVRMFVR